MWADEIYARVNEKARGFTIMEIFTHSGDLPPASDSTVSGLYTTQQLAVDTETQGLNTQAHRLCLVQLCAEDGVCHLVKLEAKDYATCTNLKKLLSDTSKQKIFHYARFDVAALQYWLDIEVSPIYCTKIASKLVRTYSQAHGLSTVVHEFLGISLKKEQQSSDWARPHLSESQKLYAASDVYYLHRVKEHLDRMLKREGREELAQACFDFLSHRVEIDGLGHPEDIFAH